MKFEDITILHRKLIERLGEDLVISLAYDTGKFYVAISVHKSTTQEYEHGRNIQSCLLDELDTDIDEIIESVVKLYKEILIFKTEQELVPDEVT